MLINQSTATKNIPFRMIATADGFSPVTGLTVTVTLSKNGAAFAAAAGAVTELADGWYVLAANATDSNTVGMLALHATGTGAVGTAQHEVVVWTPTAAPGASGGMLQVGVNSAAVSFSAGLTISKSTGVALVIASEVGMTITGTSGNGVAISGDQNGVSINGNLGTGLGISGKSGMSIIANNGVGLTIGGNDGVAGGNGAGVQISSEKYEGLRIEGFKEGIYAFSYGNTATAGMKIEGTTNGIGLEVNAYGNADAVRFTKAGTGVDLRANITGNLTGNVSGSVGSVTGNLGGNVVGNVNGTVHALDAGAIGVNTIADGAITGAKFSGAFITSGSFDASGGLFLASQAALGIWQQDYTTNPPPSPSWGELFLNFHVDLETGIDSRQAMRVFLAALAGVVTGAGTTSPIFKNPAGNATRITATTDGNGNRSNVTITA